MSFSRIKIPFELWIERERDTHTKKKKSVSFIAIQWSHLPDKSHDEKTDLDGIVVEEFMICVFCRA